MTKFYSLVAALAVFAPVAMATMKRTAAHHRSGPSAPASISSIHRKIGAQKMRTIVIAFGSCRGIVTCRAYWSRPVSPQASSDASSDSTTS